MNNIKVGDIVRCEVTGVTSYGVFVKLENGYDGLIHISEISKKFVNNIEKLYLINDLVDAKVIELDDDKKQAKLSIKRIKKRLAQRVIEEKGEGFSPLKNNLNMWIEKKLQELEKTSKL